MGIKELGLLSTATCDMMTLAGHKEGEEDDYRTDSRNVSHQQQFFSELHTPGRSHYTN